MVVIQELVVMGVLMEGMVHMEVMGRTVLDIISQKMIQKAGMLI